MLSKSNIAVVGLALMWSAGSVSANRAFCSCRGADNTGALTVVEFEGESMWPVPAEDDTCVKKCISATGCNSWWIRPSTGSEAPGFMCGIAGFDTKGGSIRMKDIEAQKASYGGIVPIQAYFGTCAENNMSESAGRCTDHQYDDAPKVKRAAGVNIARWQD